MTLAVQIFIHSNPFVGIISDVAFNRIVSRAVYARAEDIQKRYMAGEYPRDSFSFTILDPTAPASTPSEDAIMVLALIGPEGADFAPNGLAKAIEHRDSGTECGVLVYTQKHRLPSGSFRYGFSVCLDGTYVGGSGETELQDRYQCTLLAADFNLRIDTTIKEWEEVHGPGRWFSEDNKPGRRITDALVSVMSSHPMSRPGTS